MDPRKMLSKDLIVWENILKLIRDLNAVEKYSLKVHNLIIMDTNWLHSWTYVLRRNPQLDRHWKEYSEKHRITPENNMSL